MSLPFNVIEGVLIPMMLVDHVLLHRLTCPGHDEFLLDVVGDGSNSKVQLDATGGKGVDH